MVSLLQETSPPQKKKTQKGHLQQDIHRTGVANFHFNQHMALRLPTDFDGTEGWHTIAQRETCEVDASGASGVSWLWRLTGWCLRLLS